MRARLRNSDRVRAVKSSTPGCDAVRRMNKNLTNLLVLLVLVWPGIVAAQSTSSIPSVPLTAKTISVQNKAEQLFEERNYDRAFFIYRNELAPIGDKYSQYMVGFMYLTGKGVEPSRVMATAWYRLAAERGTREFETVRDQLMVSLTPEQKGECDGRYVALRKQYGDLALLMKAVRSDFETLSSRTGTRLSADSSAVTVIQIKGLGGAESGSAYYGRIQDRLKARLEYIASQTNAETGDLDSMNLSSIERLVNEHLEAPE